MGWELARIGGGGVWEVGEAKVGGGSLNRVGSGSNMDNYAAMHNILQSERAKMRGSQG